MDGHELTTPMFELSETFQYHQDDYFHPYHHDENTFADMYFKYLKQQAAPYEPSYEPHHPIVTSSPPASSLDSSDDTKIFNCSKCTKTFKTKGSLKTHFLSHSVDKAHKCYVCNKTFSQKGNLKTHSIIHSGVNPFECQICGRQFKQKGNLKTHLKTHQKPKLFQCSKCLKLFEHQRILKIHQIECQQFHQIHHQS